MDKHEYKLKSEEIKALIAQRDFFKAVKIADEIDWRRVRSVAMLCTVSDLYKINRRYKESKELLLMAYERHPGGRMILYSLCELCIKMGEVVQAIEYYKEFVQLAPMDNGKFILQYRLYEAQEVSLEERIAVLEELKKRDYREKWGYELAYLYHRIGLGTKCVEECNQLILWFSEGRYVKKAMELKMLHEPLTAAQQSSYENLMGGTKNVQKQELPKEEKPEEMDIQVQPMKIGQYDTINLQKALAESMKEVLKNEEPAPRPVTKAVEEEPVMGTVTSQIMAPMFGAEDTVQEVFFEDNQVEVSQELEPVTAQEEDKEVRQDKQPLPVDEEPHPTPTRVSDTTKEIPSIKEIMRRPLYEPMPQQEEVPEQMAGLLSQEYDGQISLVVPEELKIEKQITGQMKIEDVLIEWERTKKELEEKRRAELTQKVLAQTGSMFSDFEAKIKDGILAQLEDTPESSPYSPAVSEEAVTGFAELNLEPDMTEQVVPEFDLQPQETENAVVESSMKPEETVSTIEEADIKPEERLEEEFPEVEELTEIEDLQEDTPVSEEVAIEEETLVSGESVVREEDSVSGEPAIQEEAPIKEEALLKEEEVTNERSSAAGEAEDVSEKVSAKQDTLRDMSDEEKALFGSFIQTKGARRRFMQALDMISLAAYTGNVIVTGEADLETINLAKNVMKDIQMTDPNFSGVIAKVTGASLNSKNIEATVNKLSNGGLIIEKASGMNSQAVTTLLKALNQEQTGIVVILEDNKKAMKRMLAAYPAMESFFNARIEIEELNNDALAAYGRQYAQHLEYSIDELGMLALQTRIEDRQTNDHIVTVAEVRELVDEAIAHAGRKNLQHFLDLILGKRYDQEDMIILRERDFM